MCRRYVQFTQNYHRYDIIVIILIYYLPLQNLGLYKTFSPPHGENWKYKPLARAENGGRGDISWNDLLTHKYPTLIPSQLLKHVTLHTLTKQSTYVVRIRGKCDDTCIYELGRPVHTTWAHETLAICVLIFADAI